MEFVQAGRHHRRNPYLACTASGVRPLPWQELSIRCRWLCRQLPTSTQPEAPSYADPYAEFVGPKFPISILPSVLADYVVAEHKAMGADPSALAMASLAAVGAALTSETKVQVGDGWYERPIIWVALVGEPSTMKSPVITKTTKPLFEIDNDADARWRIAKSTYDQQKAAGMNPGCTRPAAALHYPMMLLPKRLRKYSPADQPARYGSG